MHVSNANTAIIRFELNIALLITVHRQFMRGERTSVNRTAIVRGTELLSRGSGKVLNFFQHRHLSQYCQEFFLDWMILRNPESTLVSHFSRPPTRTSRFVNSSRRSIRLQQEAHGSWVALDFENAASEMIVDQLEMRHLLS